MGKVGAGVGHNEDPALSSVLFTEPLEIAFEWDALVILQEEELLFASSLRPLLKLQPPLSRGSHEGSLRFLPTLNDGVLSTNRASSPLQTASVAKPGDQQRAGEFPSMHLHPGQTGGTAPQYKVRKFSNAVSTSHKNAVYNHPNSLARASVVNGARNE